MTTRDPNYPPGYVREFDPESDVAWFGEHWAPPPFYRRVVVDEFERPGALGWRRLAGRRGCRYTAGPDRRQCGADAVVELKRGLGHDGRSWWAYCPDHLFGRCWDPPRVLAAILWRSPLLPLPPDPDPITRRL